MIKGHESRWSRTEQKTQNWLQTYGRKSMVVPPDLGLKISTGKFFEEVTITIEKLHTKPLQQVVLCITIYLLVLMMNNI